MNHHVVILLTICPYYFIIKLYEGAVPRTLHKHRSKPGSLSVRRNLFVPYLNSLLTLTTTLKVGYSGGRTERASDNPAKRPNRATARHTRLDQHSSPAAAGDTDEVRSRRFHLFGRATGYLAVARHTRVLSRGSCQRRGICNLGPVQLSPLPILHLERTVHPRDAAQTGDAAVGGI